MQAVSKSSEGRFIIGGPMKILRQSKDTQYIEGEECYKPEYGEVVKIQSPDGSRYIYVMKVEGWERCSNCPMCLEYTNDEYDCSYIPLWCGLFDSYVNIEQVLEDL